MSKTYVGSVYRLKDGSYGVTLPGDDDTIEYRAVLIPASADPDGVADVLSEAYFNALDAIPLEDPEPVRDAECCKCHKTCTPEDQVGIPGIVGIWIHCRACYQDAQ